MGTLLWVATATFIIGFLIGTRVGVRSMGNMIRSAMKGEPGEGQDHLRSALFIYGWKK